MEYLSRSLKYKAFTRICLFNKIWFCPDNTKYVFFPTKYVDHAKYEFFAHILRLALIFRLFR